MEFFDNLMAPLDKNYCIYFYISGLFALFSAVLALVSIVGSSNGCRIFSK